MVSFDVLLPGVPGRTDRGYLGQSTAVLVDGTTLVDTGSRARRPVLRDALDAVGVAPEAVEDVLLTHLHFDHVENLDLFEAATAHVYGPELDRVRAGDLDWATAPTVTDLLAGRVARFEEGEVLPGIEAVHTPGHVAEHVSFLVEADRTYGLVGDAVKNLREFATRDPTAVYDEAVAAETVAALADRLDVVFPGHDAPFLVTETGAAPCGDPELTVALQTGPAGGTRVTVAGDREDRRPLPDPVRVVEAAGPLD